jgi:Zn-dependent metalloprotease
MTYNVFCSCSQSQHNPLHCVVPPYIVDRLTQSKNPKVRKAALASLVEDAQFRTSRRMISMAPQLAALGSAQSKKNRLVYSAKNARTLPGKLIRVEGSARSKDVTVNEAYDYSGATYDFFFKLFGRKSLDDKNMSLVSTVHAIEPRGGPLNNAFWNGTQMVYGDGDGVIFNRFTQSIDVVAHELTHGITSFTSNLTYQDEPGALNEHFSDVFGSLVRQWYLGQTAKAADWLIGKDILLPASSGTRRALRDMLNPGTAYVNDPELGDDPQPASYAKRYLGRLDNGGVHLNSGIANRAFALTAIALGGNAWTTAGAIWYDLLRQLSPNSGFADCAKLCRQIAGGYGRRTSAAVDKAWTAVGLG